MAWTIRPAAIDDAAGIAGIHVRTWQSAYRGLVPDDALAAMTPEARMPMWGRLLADPPKGHDVLVAESGQRLVGFCSFGPARNVSSGDDALELHTIYVDPAAQGGGAGTALLHAAEAAMQDAGAPSAKLWVLDGNHQAQRFYRKHGWQPDGGVKDDVLFGVSVREVRFRKSLGLRSSGL